MFEAALGTALCFILIMLCYFDIKKIAGFALLVDVAIFAVMIWLFKGTYAGMMTGIIAGIIITLFLNIVRRTFGYKTLAIKRQSTKLVPTVYWNSHRPQRR